MRRSEGREEHSDDRDERSESQVVCSLLTPFSRRFAHHSFSEFRTQKLLGERDVKGEIEELRVKVEGMAGMGNQEMRNYVSATQGVAKITGDLVKFAIDRGGGDNVLTVGRRVRILGGVGLGVVNRVGVVVKTWRGEDLWVYVDWTGRTEAGNEGAGEGEEGYVGGVGGKKFRVVKCKVDDVAWVEKGSCKVDAGVLVKEAAVGGVGGGGGGWGKPRAKKVVLGRAFP